MVPNIPNVVVVVCFCTPNIQASPDYVTVRASTIKVTADIAQRISGTDISERCAIVSNRYNIATTKKLLTKGAFDYDTEIGRAS